MVNGEWTGAVVIAGTLESGIVFHKAWGYLSVDKQVKMSESALFDLASLTKTFATATALAICVDKGLIDLSMPFVNYFPEYKGILLKEVTVQDLARHLSGFDNRKPYIVDGNVVENVLKYSPVRKSGYEYSCINYILLGMIIEKVTGESLDQFCMNNIFYPLMMKETQWGPLIEADSLQTVKSIFSPKLGDISDEPARAAKKAIGNAGLFSTAEDLSKYCLMILNDGMYKDKRILSGNSIQLLSTRPDMESTVSLGWRVGKDQNPSLLSWKTLSHTGYTGGSVWIDLGQQKFVIILTNRIGDHIKSKQTRHNFAELLLKEMRN
jgi:CubicO group peptidase (beta-lactamase class C family)